MTSTTSKKAVQPSLIDKIMNEVIISGGLPMRRCDCYQIMVEGGFDSRTVDYFSFKPIAVQGVEPMTRDALRPLLLRDAA